jgi:hypothetical protein
MNRTRLILRPTAQILLLAQLFMFVLPAANAAMVSSEAMLAASVDRQMLIDTLAREDVRESLIAHGVQPAEALARVQALSDVDVTLLSQEFDGVPAGGSISGLILITFAIWVVVHATDTFAFLFPDDEKAEKKAE